MQLANNGQIPTATIGYSILTMLHDRNPEEILPYLITKEKMKLLKGKYINHTKHIQATVTEESGMLYLETNLLEIKTKQALIPLDPLMKDNKFYTYAFGEKQMVEFIIDSSINKIYLKVERHEFEKK